MAFSTLTRIPLISAMPEGQKPEKRGQSNRMYSENNGYLKGKGPRLKGVTTNLLVGTLMIRPTILMKLMALKELLKVGFIVIICPFNLSSINV